METIQVNEGDEGKRVDRFLTSQLEGLSRVTVRRLIDSGKILLNGKQISANHKTRAGEEFTVEMPEVLEPSIEAEDIPIEIVYEDSDIVIVNKGVGMVVHPAKGHYTGTLVNALLFHCKDLSGIGGEMRPGIVHRLDKNTSGLIAVAKNDSAHASLCKQLEERSMGREYRAVVKGTMKERSATIDKPIGRHSVYRKKMSVKTKRGRDAITKYETIEKFENATYLKVKLKTGRTHQIRVHLSSIGNPIIGDMVYGKDKTKLIDRPALHAIGLELKHPKTGETKNFECELPDDFEKLLENLRAGNSG